MHVHYLFQSTHVVANDAEKADVSYKCKMAAKFGIPVVNVDYLYDCVDQEKHLDTDAYLLVGKTKSEQLSTGKITGKSWKVGSYQICLRSSVDQLA